MPNIMIRLTFLLVFTKLVFALEMDNQTRINFIFELEEGLSIIIPSQESVLISSDESIKNFKLFFFTAAHVCKIKNIKDINKTPFRIQESNKEIIFNLQIVGKSRKIPYELSKYQKLTIKIYDKYDNDTLLVVLEKKTDIEIKDDINAILNCKCSIL